jgi:predicted ATPase
VIVETHSSLLLRGIQIAVADGDIDPDFVNLHWFTRDDMTGMSRVDSASLDDYGRFGDWPSDFDDTAIDTDGEFLDAVAARLGDD